jgi:hypothetical protein
LHARNNSDIHKNKLGKHIHDPDLDCQKLKVLKVKKKHRKRFSNQDLDSNLSAIS